MSTLGYIHSTESFGAVDGPGVRFVIFMQGCKMRCKYCHNPDTWDMTQAAETVSAQELVTRALRYKEYWGAQGGITVSGGEPLLQVEFVTELLQIAHSHGIHTAIDTSGQPYLSIDKQAFDVLCDVCDLFIIDMKHLDSDAHKALTGHDNAAVKQMIEDLDARRKPMWVRHVLVPGITESPQHLTALAAYLDAFKNIQKREILPYHTLGIDKWKQLGLDYKLKRTPTPTDAQIAQAKAIFEK